MFRVFVINDLYEDWEGTVSLRIVNDGRSLSGGSQSCRVPSLGRQVLAIEQAIPSEPGQYTLVAELTDPSGRTVRSLRDFRATRGE